MFQETKGLSSDFPLTLGLSPALDWGQPWFCPATSCLAGLQGWRLAPPWTFCFSAAPTSCENLFLKSSLEDSMVLPTHTEFDNLYVCVYTHTHMESEFSWASKSCNNLVWLKTHPRHMFVNKDTCIFFFCQKKSICKKTLLKKPKPTPKAHFKTSLPCETDTLLYQSFLGNAQT